MSPAPTSAVVTRQAVRTGPLLSAGAGRVRAALAALSAGAAVIHVIVAANHLGGPWQETAFFAAAALFGLVWAGAIAVSGARGVLITGLAGNVALVAVWLLSRTVGVPVGAHAGEVLSVGLTDVVSQLLHVLLIAGAGLLLARHRARARWPVPRALAGASLAVLLAVVPLTAAAAGVAALEGGHEQGHGHGQAHDAGEVSPGEGEHGHGHEEDRAEEPEQAHEQDSADEDEREREEDSTNRHGRDEDRTDESGREPHADGHAHEHEDDHDHDEPGDGHTPRDPQS